MSLATVLVPEHDASLASMLQVDLVDHDRRIALLPLERRVHAPKTPHVQAAEGRRLAPEPDPLVMIEMSRLLKDRKLYGMGSLRHHWYSKEDASGSEFNVALELIKLNKSDAFISQALWRRPHSKAFRNGQAYVDELIADAHATAIRIASLTPSGIVAKGSRWLEHHRLWQVVGDKALRIFNFHLFASLSANGKEVPDGEWTPIYWLSVREVVNANICRQHRAVLRAHWFMKRLGLLRLVKQGKGQAASEWQACKPTPDQVDAMVIEAIKAKEAWKDGGRRVNPPKKKG